MPFRDIVGHRRLIGLVARSIESGTLPPSLILAGPEGIGKRLLAIATAQALNCFRPGISGAQASSQVDDAGFDACGTCASCTKIARGVHPDVHFVVPGDSGSIKIEQVRDVVDRAGYRPFEGRRRVVVFDQADALVPQAQNALLKTLEEPAPSSVFLLVTSRPDALLPTVLSRCPRLRFRPLDVEDVAAVLIRQGRSEAEARAVAATADGSVGHALSASGADLVEARDVAARVLAHASGTDDARRRLESAKDLLARTGAGGAGDREQLAVNLRAMASLVRDAELLSTRADDRALANPDVRKAVERLSAFRGERGVHAFTAIDQALVALERNAGVKVVADWVVLQL
jgi:DNA polymerase-3 subunit delta'